VKFREMVESSVLPDAVVNLLVPSWLTDEVITPAVRTDIRAL
jgi:hypothetical protein